MLKKFFKWLIFFTFKRLDKKELEYLVFNKLDKKELERLLFLTFNKVYESELELERVAIKDGTIPNDTLVPTNQYTFKNFNYPIKFGFSEDYVIYSNLDREKQICTLKVKLTKQAILRLIDDGYIFLHIPKTQTIELKMFGISVESDEGKVFNYKKELNKHPNLIV